MKKKLLTILLATFMVLTLVPTTIFAEGDGNDKTGSTSITATVSEQTFEYTIAIPSDTTINSFGIHQVGTIAPHVENVKGAVAGTIISYTAETSNFTKSGSNETMEASYYTDSEGKSLFPTTAIDVYKDDDYVSELPSMFVGISETVWKAATPGTYTATVTFNFTASIPPAPSTAGIYDADGKLLEPLTLEDCGEDASGVASKLTGENLTVILPSGVTSICDNAFFECANLVSITIPNTVISIGFISPDDPAYGVFNNCTNLTTVTFEEGSQLTTIGDKAFERCGNLASITIPSTVKEIGEYAFYWTGLKSVTFEEGSELGMIGDYAFDLCESLTSVTIPASVTEIGTGAFNECTSLETVTFKEGSNLTTIGVNAFVQISASSLDIPSSVTTIGECAFGDDEIEWHIPNVNIDLSKITDEDSQSYFPWGASNINGAAPVNPWED